MPIDILSPSKRKDNCLIMRKIQSYICKNAINHERMQRLKKFQSLQKSFNIKRINIRRPLQYIKVEKTQKFNEKKEKILTNRKSSNEISTIKSLKQKIKTLQKDDISDFDLQIKLKHLKRQPQQFKNENNTQRYVQDMIHQYRKARNQAGQFRSQNNLEIIQIKKTVCQDRQKPRVKSLQLCNRSSKDFMRSVYLKFINGEQSKGQLQVRELDKKGMSLTAKKFYDSKKTNYRSRTQSFWNQCEDQSRSQIRANKIKLFKNRYRLSTQPATNKNSQGQGI